MFFKGKLSTSSLSGAEFLRLKPVSVKRLAGSYSPMALNQWGEGAWQVGKATSFESDDMEIVEVEDSG